MVDSILFPWSGRTILTTVGTGTAPVSGAQLEVFDAGTTNQKTVYTDSALTTPAANPVVADNAGVVPLRYLGAGAYKITFEDSNDTPLSQYPTWDNVPGPLDTSGFLTGAVSPTRPVTNVSTNTTLLEANDGEHINADATGGSITVTLRSAIAMGDGNDVVIKHSGTANTVTVSATQLIDTKNSFILNPGDAATFRSDGGNFHISEAFSFTDGIVTITYAAAITPDFVFPSDTDYQITLTGGMTVNAPTSPRVGQRGTFTIIQDGTGAHVTTWDSAYNQTGNFQLDTVANAINKVNFHVRETGEIDLWVGNQGTVSTREQIAQNTGLSSTSSNFASISGEYEFLELELQGVTADGVHQLFLNLSEDNGTTFLSMFGYAHGDNSGGGEVFNATTTTTTGISIHPSNENAAGETSGTIWFRNYTNSIDKHWEGSVGSTGSAGIAAVKGQTLNSTTAINYIRLRPSAGNFDGGTVTLYGWRNG